MSSTSSHYRGDIDGLRFVSILLVVLYHAGVTRFGGGYVGVDVFFVISGYLITGLLLREYRSTGEINLVDFFARRIRRLLPLAATVLATTLVIGGWLLTPLQRTSLITDARWASLYGANWRFGAQTAEYTAVNPTESLLLHYWSLSIEEQFYVLWPLVVVIAFWAVRARGARLQTGLLLFVTAIIVAGSFAVAVANAIQLVPGSYFSSFGRFWEMGVGALLAIAAPSLQSLQTPRNRAPLVAIGLGAILVAAVSYGAQTPFPGYAALVPVLGAAMIIVFGANSSASAEPRSIDLLAWGPLPALGRLSYAWYLWHWPAIGIALLANQRWDLGLGTGVVTFAAVAVSFGLAWISHHLIENPIRLAHRLSASTRPNFALGAALMLAPVIGGFLFLAAGNTGTTTVAAPAVITNDAPSSVAPSTTDAGNSRAPRTTPTTTAVAAPETSLVPTTLLVRAMTPEDAANDSVGQDRPALAMGACFSSFEDVEIAPDCVFGDENGERTIIAIGDSHMQHFLPALHLAGEENGWRVLSWIKGACPVTGASLWSNQLSRPFHECDEWNENLLAALEGVEADGVLIARAFQHQERLVDEDGQILEQPEGIAQAWAAGHRDVHDQLTERFGTVVVMRDTPRAPHNVANCLSRNPTETSQCGFPAEGHALRDTILFDAEVRAVGTQHHLDVTPYVCESDPCQMVTAGGVIKYRDTQHLTGTFSTTLAPVFSVLLEEAFFQTT